MARNGSASPSQQLSKREKRRRTIKDKLDAMISTFSQDQTAHYRAQLQAIQTDMTLILRADPYENVPLDDDPQKIEELVESLIGGKAGKEDFYALAGRRYYEYCQEINRAQEQRDADLTMLKNCYDGATAELERTHAFKMQVAQREHAELASTIRQRLINTVNKKRDRLLRDKEQLDIADSNSLLLHPNHYAMNAPASPGGLLSNRKTRHTRNRNGDAEEPLVERGRKRKLPVDEDGNESPVPGYRPITQDGSGAFSPFPDQRAKILRSQQEAPAYSIDSIFTEKELAHATSIAQFATHHFFYQQPPEQNQAPAQTNGKAPSVPSIDGTAEPRGGTEGERAPSPPPVLEATGMERQVSNYATRGATRANPLSFLSDTALAISTSGLTTTDPAVNPFLPAMIPITRTDKGAPTPPGASVRDISNDLLMITGSDKDPIPNKFFAKPAETAVEGELTVSEARDLFLEQACRDSLSTYPFRTPLTDVGPAMIKDGVHRPAALGFADPAQTAGLSGQSALIGQAMSRVASDVGSEAGGAAMRRTRSTRAA